MESRALATLGVRAGLATRGSESCSGGALSCPLTVQTTREPSSRRVVWPGLRRSPGFQAALKQGMRPRAPISADSRVVF